MPGMATRTAWSWAMIASWRSGVGREPDDRERDLRSDAVDRQQQREEAELLGRAEAVQRLLVLADEVVGVQLEPSARLGRREDRRRREHPVADAADLDDERIGGDRADDPLDRGDHPTPAAGRSSPYEALRCRRSARSAAIASRTARS